MNGGYLMVSKSDTNLYAKLNNALTVGKPILWYEDETTCYYIDTITKSGTDIILTKGGKTITIENDGTITEVGDVLNPLMDNIKDLAGNLRFIEDAGVLATISGVTFTYNKISLSGTHLMIVLAGSIDNTTALTTNLLLADYNVPEYIYDKISALFGTVVDVKSVTFYASDWSNQNANIILRKENDKISLYCGANVTMSADRNFRIQFDLLIDAE